MNNRPLRVAIIGSGPSGFYSVQALLKSQQAVIIDIFEKYPVPYGLVRSGVAPDHPKIKNVTAVFDKLAREENVRFFGNVEIGKDLTVPELAKCYDAIVFAHGAETDKRLGIDGEDLPGSHTATEFVGWYNGHPEYRERTFDLSGERAIVIGQGNVAVDVARILAKTPDELKTTDIAAHALEALGESKIREIYMVGRRGPMQAAFTEKEIREMGELEDCGVHVPSAHLNLETSCQAELDQAPKSREAKNFSILTDFASRSDEEKRKKLVIEFFRSPIEILGTNRVESLTFGVNTLSGEPGSQRATLTDVTETLSCDLVFRSIGYRGTPIAELPFDERKGTYPQIKGRILSDGDPLTGFYAAGWIKRGPSGIIGTNKPDSAETIKSILEDSSSLLQKEKEDLSQIQSILETRKVRIVSFDDWLAIDKAEIERGKAQDKPREKFTRVEEMLSVLQDS